MTSHRTLINKHHTSLFIMGLVKQIAKAIVKANQKLDRIERQEYCEDVIDAAANNAKFDNYTDVIPKVPRQQACEINKYWKYREDPVIKARMKELE